eukprot:2952689-Rhodomonas_salina.2
MGAQCGVILQPKKVYWKQEPSYLEGGGSLSCDIGLRSTRYSVPASTAQTKTNRCPQGIKQGDGEFTVQVEELTVMTTYAIVVEPVMQEAFNFTGVPTLDNIDELKRVPNTRVERSDPNHEIRPRHGFKQTIARGVALDLGMQRWVPGTDARFLAVEVVLGNALDMNWEEVNQLLCLRI